MTHTKSEGDSAKFDCLKSDVMESLVLEGL